MPSADTSVDNDTFGATVADPELKDFYDSLRTEADLEQLIHERAQENLHLELKQKKDRSTGKLDDSDKFQFSRALSGFANSDGGVLLWGIESDGNDRAKGLKPISGVADFQGRLKKSLLNAAQPTVDGVLLEVIPCRENADQGYVKCLIPSSQKIPHRGMLADREYYKRSTEGFYRLEHFDLEDMFGRRPVPSLRLQTRILQQGSIGSPKGEMMKGYAIISIENIGRGSARAPYLVLSATPHYDISEHGLDGNGHEGLPRIHSGTPKRYIYTSSDGVIHPGVLYDVTAYKVHGFLGSDHRLTMPEELRIAYELGAENTQVRVAELAVSSEEIAAVVFPPTVFARPQPVESAESR